VFLQLPTKIGTIDEISMVIIVREEIMRTIIVKCIEVFVCWSGEQSCSDRGCAGVCDRLDAYATTTYAIAVPHFCWLTVCRWNKFKTGSVTATSQSQLIFTLTWIFLRKRKQQVLWLGSAIRFLRWVKIWMRKLWQTFRKKAHQRESL